MVEFRVCVNYKSHKGAVAIEEKSHQSRRLRIERLIECNKAQARQVQFTRKVALKTFAINEGEKFDSFPLPPFSDRFFDYLLEVSAA